MGLFLHSAAERNDAVVHTLYKLELTMEAEAQTYLSEIRTSLAVITEKVTRLDKNMNGNGVPGLLDRVKTMEINHQTGACNYTRVENELHEKIESVVMERKAVTEALKSDVKAIKDVLPGLTFTNKILTWVGMILGAAVIGLIWSLITNQISIVR